MNATLMKSSLRYSIPAVMLLLIASMALAQYAIDCTPLTAAVARAREVFIPSAARLASPMPADR
jgi:hypothetical protein